MTLLIILPLLQQSGEDIRSVNSTWLLTIVFTIVFIMGLLGGIAKGGGDD